MASRSLRNALAAVLLVALAAACGGGGGGGDDGGGGGDGGGRFPDAGPALPRVSQLIRADPFPAMVLELDIVPGMAPRTSSEDDMVAGLMPLVDKPGGIQLVEDGTIASRGADHAWSFDELQQVADQTFDLAVPSDTIKMHAMFIDGHSDQDSDQGLILGLAWANTHVAIFKQTIEANCGTLGSSILDEQQCAGAEFSIWTHETGHTLGLVDDGLPMVTDHRDPDTTHGAHDASDQCVMYWAYEGQGVFDVIGQQILGGGSNEMKFDDACKADLAAERARP